MYVEFIYKYVLCFSIERILCSVKRDSAFFPVVHSTFFKKIWSYSRLACPTHARGKEGKYEGRRELRMGSYHSSADGKIGKSFTWKGKPVIDLWVCSLKRKQNKLPSGKCNLGGKGTQCSDKGIEQQIKKSVKFQHPWRSARESQHLDKPFLIFQKKI